MTQPTEEQIRTRAYLLWEADGRQSNRDWEYWLKAKQELSTQTAEIATAAPPATASKAESKSGATLKAPKRRNSTRAAVYA